jgi:hypothetical protein
MRDLYQNAGPVSGFRIASTCAAVREVNENLNSLADYLMTFFAANARYESNAARIMLVRRIIKPLGRGKPVLEMGLHGSGKLHRNNNLT